MLDLKAKLAAAGLVTKQDVERVEKQKSGKRGGKNRKKKKNRGLAVAELKSKGKGERYDAIRREVGKARLDDPGRPPSDQAQPFHFPTAAGSVGRLVLEADVLARVREGSAGIVAFMSNHGLAHAVVPAGLARGVAELFPLWLRVLEGHPDAGRLESRDDAESKSEAGRDADPTDSGEAG